MKRVLSIFDTNGDGRVSFIEFLVGLSKLAAGTDEMQKTKFAFDVYDINKDGHISNGELFAVMKMMVGNNLNDQQVSQIRDVPAKFPLAMNTTSRYAYCQLSGSFAAFCYSACMDSGSLWCFLPWDLTNVRVWTCSTSFGVRAAEAIPWSERLDPAWIFSQSILLRGCVF